MIKELILATSNSGKIAELNTLLAPIHCIPQQTLDIPDIEETGLTFIENALIKARHAAILGKKPALADDSGLVVPYLNGEPGIYSARFAMRQGNTEQDNIDYLLERLQGVTGDKRRAYFYCAIAIVRFKNDPTPIIATGILHGMITLQRHGRQGFGYDPVFYLQSHQATLAELTSSIKNTLSHRAQALNKIKNTFNTND